MKDNQEYILLKSIELRHSPFVFETEDPCKIKHGIHRSFILQFNLNIDRMFMFIHFKHLKINAMELYYRKKSGKNRKTRKVYPQHKMRLTFDNTHELLYYLGCKNYKIDWFEIRFQNGWVIKSCWLNGIEFITNNTIERNLLIEKLIAISGQGPININSLQINQAYAFCINGELKQKAFLV